MNKGYQNFLIKRYFIYLYLIRYYIYIQYMNSRLMVSGEGSEETEEDLRNSETDGWNYDIYGMPTIWDFKTDPNNPTVVSNSLIGNTLLFHGRRYDPETNLYYYRARYYDPITGRFLSTDPIGYQDSMNLYQAFNMNGWNYVDPMGEEYYVFDAERKKVAIYKDKADFVNKSKQDNLFNSIFGLFGSVDRKVDISSLPEPLRLQATALGEMSGRSEKRIEFYDRVGGEDRQGYNATAHVYNSRGNGQIEYDTFDARTIPSDIFHYPSIKNGEYIGIFQILHPKLNKSNPRRYPAIGIRTKKGDYRIPTVMINIAFTEQVLRYESFNTIININNRNEIQFSLNYPIEWYASWILIHKSNPYNDETGAGITGSTMSTGCLMIRNSKWKKFYRDILNVKKSNNTINIKLNTSANR